MKFFMQYTTTNHKIRHAIAVELSKMYPGSRFAASIASNGQEIQEFLAAQKDIIYEFLDDHRDIQHAALKESPVDYDLLRWFENKTPEKSLWRYFAVDREWCYQYLQGTVYLPRTVTHTLSNHDNILKVACGFIRYYKKVMEEYKPDVFIAANGQNNISCPVADQMCKIYGVLYVTPETIRTQNYMALTNNRQYVFDHVDDTCRRLMDGSLVLDMQRGEKIFEEIQNDLHSSQYFDVSHIGHLKARWPFFAFLGRSLRSCAGVVLLWIRQTPLRRNSRTFARPVDRLSNFFYLLYVAVVRQYHRMQLMDDRFYGTFDKNEKYIYFPLHNTNEYSTQVQGTMWMDQLPLIEALSKSIPVGWKLYIKEHPGMLLHRVRRSNLYKTVKRLPNVVFIPTQTNTHEVISFAQMVITIIGTTGWEAVMRGKPVLSLEENMFDVLDLSRRCTDFKEFSRAIRGEIERVSKISDEERRRRIVCLLTAIAHCGFWTENPLKVLGEAECSSAEERKKYAEIITGCMKKYFEFHRVVPVEEYSSVRAA